MSTSDHHYLWYKACARPHLRRAGAAWRPAPSSGCRGRAATRGAAMPMPQPLAARPSWSPGSPARWPSRWPWPWPREPGGGGGPVQGRGGPGAAGGGRGALCAHRPGHGRRGRPPGRRRLRHQLRRVQVQRLGPRPAGQQRRAGLADGAPPRGHRLPPLLDHRGLQAHGPSRLRRGGRAGRQPRRLALPPHLQHLQDRRRGHRPLGGGPLRRSPPPSPGCRCPTGTGVAGRPSTSR